MSLQLRDCHLLSGWLNLGEPNGFVIWPPADLGGQPIPGSVSLVNNLFERVNTSLDPDTGPCWWGGGQSAATIDLSLAATNNLFRGGWLFLAPAPATAGDWVFENNLFDKVVLAQDQSQPLDYAHNAYWPCVGTWPEDVDGELFHGQVEHLYPTTTRGTYTDGTYETGNELKLTDEPPYRTQTGLLGDFYLEDDSPLSGAGSCPPASVGLYHYTTSTSQAKEDGAGNVTIGMHYIALETAGANAGQPKDSDGDQIPDYVENWHGDGDYSAHTDTETSWLLPETVSGTPDARNPVYGDIDLDGDGLTGAAETVLGKEPLVMDNPFASAALSLQDTVSGTVSIPLNVDPSVDEGVSMEFMVDGEPAAAVVHKVDGNWVAEWDTMLLANGMHYMAIEVHIDGGGESTAIPSPAKFLRVQNDICFPGALLMAGDALCVNAQTVHTNGTWTMDVYDDQNNLVAALDGNVDENGFCRGGDPSEEGVTFSLLDEEGNALESDYFTVTVTTSAVPGSGGGSASASEKYGRELSWGPNDRPGRWVVAYLSAFPGHLDWR